ncbi:hypothetical protein [Hyalangium gracile]|uniref:hypothetical protein n=1 Tax=Hyalangium gracile TaxID=394092 RepID=UPI001CCFFC56|nr:hypothetical protein [Hyalangium gracile]
MTVGNATSAPRTAAAPQTTSTGEKFKSMDEITDFLKNDSGIQDLRYMLAGTSGEKADAGTKIANSSFVKSFEANLKKAVDKLGPNASKEDVQKAANNEAYKQELFKSVVNKAASRVMSRVKEMYSDTWG